MTSGWDQLRALVALRWTMVRSSAARGGLLALLACVPLAVAGGAVAAQVTPSGTRFEAALVVPTIYLGFAVLSAVSPLSSGGGNELYPPDQLVAFPIRPSTHYLTGLAVMPINLAWVSQLTILAAATSFALPPTVTAPLAVVTVAAYVVLATALGQLGSWLVAGARQTARGRRLVAALAVAAVTAVALVARTGRTTDVLDESPTIAVVAAMVGVADSRAYGFWSVTTGALALLAAATLYAGRAACAWALSRPGDTAPESREMRARRQRRTAFGELLAVDRASVWRSASLRRGALVLGLLPGAVAFALGVDWSTLILLPGLVASGAALLFGVNAFCLDAGGALWLATLPYDPRLALRSKAFVVGETALACVLLAVGAGLLRVERAPTAAEAAGLAAAVVATTVSVLGTCLRLSVERPHRADLRGRRDTPAPPGTMAVYSTRLAAQTTFTGLWVAGAAATGVAWMPLLAALPVVLLGLRSMLAAGRTWANAVNRAYVTVTVAAG